jgi:hypothetical protein
MVPIYYKLNRSSDGKLILPPVNAGIGIRIEPCIL